MFEDAFQCEATMTKAIPVAFLRKESATKQEALEQSVAELGAPHSLGFGGPHLIIKT